MNIKELVSEFELKLSELGNTYPTEEWITLRRILATRLSLSQVELAYDKLKKQNPKIHSGFFERHVPFTHEEKLAIKRAASLNRQIGSKLGKIRRGEV